MGNYKQKKQVNPYYMKPLESNVSGTGRPERKEDHTSNNILERKMTRDLPLAANSVIVKADPYTEGKGNSSPYKFYNRNNPITSPKYGGDANLEGSKAMQMYDYPNSSFNHFFDSMSIRMTTNYRMLNLINKSNAANVDVTNDGLITDMFKSFLDFLSKVENTMYYQFEAFKHVVKTNIQVHGGATDPNYAVWVPYMVTDLGTGDVYYTGAAAVFLEAIFYQTVLQRVATTFCYVNKERAYRGELKKMGTDRENSRLEMLWGRFDSASWLSNWKSIASLLEGEYFDDTELTQSNILAMMMSRKSDSMQDPVQSLISLPFVLDSTENDEFKVYADWDPKTTSPVTLLFDLAQMDQAGGMISIEYPVYTPSGTDDISGQHYYSFAKSTRIIANIMDPLATQYWARVKWRQDFGDYATLTAISHQEYSNHVVTLLTLLNSQVAYLKGSFNELKKVLEHAIRVNICRWTQRVTLGILKEKNLQIYNNIFISDLIKSMFTGSVTLQFSDETMRWIGNTLFDKYYGIPHYDFFSGGACISFSVKNIEATAGSTAQLMSRRLPYLIHSVDMNSNLNHEFFLGCPASTRVGEVVHLGIQSINNVANYPILTRLFPLKDYDIVRMCSNVEAFNVDAVTDIYGKQTLSLFYNLIESILKLGIIRLTDNNHNNSTDTILSSDIMLFTDFQILDQTNIMINYGRSAGPFRSFNEIPDIGFKI